MAKTKSMDEEIFDGLKKAYAAMLASKPLPLTGTGGVFATKDSKKNMALAERAIEQHYLTRTDTTVLKGKGKSKTPTTVTMARLTVDGIKKVLEQESPKAALTALVPLVKKFSEQATPPPLDAFRSALDAATEKCVATIRAAFEGMKSDVKQLLTPEGANVDPAPVLAALHAALEKVEPKVIEIPASASASSPEPATPGTTSVDTLGNEIVQFVDAVARERTVGCDFVELFDYLKAKHPDLTIGTFHDALRALDDARRIRLTGWPRMHDEMPRPELALFIASKVMYHAHPIH